MSNAIQYNWSVWCNTEGTFVNIIQKPKPSVCPHNASHSIDLSITYFTPELAGPSILTVAANVGYYQAKGYSFTGTANATTTYDLTFPFDITLQNGIFLVEDVNQGDNLTVILAPDSTIGLTTQDININDTIIYVNNSVILYAIKGVTLSFGNSDKYIVKSVNLNNSTLTLTTAAINNYASGSVVTRNIYIVNNITFPTKALINFGRNTPANSYVPAGYIFRFLYTNISMSTDKLFNFIIEYY